MSSSRCVFMLLVLFVVFHNSEAKPGSKSSSKTSSIKSSKKSGSACDECSVCPRVCSYSDQKCYLQFEIPEANKTDIFIDEFELPLNNLSLFAICQAACNANVDCKIAIVEWRIISTPQGSTTFELSCVLSKLTATEIVAVPGAILDGDCSGVLQGPLVIIYYAYTVVGCI